jgi:ATP-binding cassette subfamily B protein
MEEQRSKQAYKLVLSHYWQQAKHNWKYSLPGVLFPGIGSIFVFYVPTLFIAHIISAYQAGHSIDVSDSLPLVALFAGSWLFGEALWRIGQFFMVRAEVIAVDSLYKNALRMLIEKDLSFFHENFAGSLTKKTVGYATRYIDVFDTLVYNVASNIIPALFACVVLWHYSPLLVLFLVGMTCFTLALVTPLIRKRRKLVVVRETATNVVSGHIADVYSNIDAVRAFAHEDAENKRNAFLVKDLTNKIKKSWDYQNSHIDMVISPLFVLCNAVGLVLALYLAQKGSIGIAAVLIVFNYFATVTRFMWEFNGIYRRLESALSDAAQFTELLLDEPKVNDIDKPEVFIPNEGKIEFSNVHFQYQDDNNQELFTDLNLTIQPGEKIGLVGHSGGGKTTITKLLMRFMDIDSGAILVDNQDIAKVRQDDLRSAIAYVPQDPYMFHRSIADNIRYGKLDASDEEVQLAAKRSHSVEFIDKLPKGYDTLIGERGVKLSGGQRQRIAVARAMIKHAPILLLDEATSALDSESEKLIQDALWKLMENKTAIVIAHRLSTIQKMDRILVLENGAIVEEGSHAELLKNNGIYSELWKHQSGGFLED